MSSISVGDENSFKYSNDVSHISEDLFGDSPKYSSNKTSEEVLNETWEEFKTFTGEKNHKPLILSDGENNSRHLKDLEVSFSKVFQPISPANSNEVYNNSGLLGLQKSPKSASQCYGIGSLNITNKSEKKIVPDSDESGSSILNDSENLINEKSFKTPCFNHTKTHLIKHWLSSVSLSSVTPKKKIQFTDAYTPRHNITVGKILPRKIKLSSLESHNLTDNSLAKHSCENSPDLSLETAKDENTSEHAVYSIDNKEQDYFENVASQELCDETDQSNKSYNQNVSVQLEKGFARNKTQSIQSDDDSFSNIRFSNKKKIYQISSDESDTDKDTATEELIAPVRKSDLCTPKRRLFYHNPTNDSLDDSLNDTNPGFNKKDFLNKYLEKESVTKHLDESNLVRKICMDVLNNSTRSSVKCNSLDNKSSLNGCVGIKENVNESIQKFESPFNVDNSSNNIVYKGSNENICSPNKSVNKDTVNESKPSPTMPEKNRSFTVDTVSDEELDNFDFKFLKKKSNVLNDSTDDERVDKSGSLSSDLIICDNPEVTSKITKNVTIDLTASDNEYDKYLYRTRSDSSCSDVPSKTGSADNVVTIHTTSDSEESGDNNDNSPWFDLESYLKKSVPASSKNLETSFVKNADRRKEKLAKISLPSHSSCPEHTSFLLSLTPEVSYEICHPEAIKYRGESFSKHKNELIDLLFKMYNQDIFDNKLPPIEIKWSGRLTTTSGITKSCSRITKQGKIRISVIKLSKTIVDTASKMRDVLLHELCHAANWLIDEQSGGHGPLFKKWVHKAWMKYPEVPKVRTCHHYELKWKYIYKCNFCGYELGKMKLNVNENSCRLCGGLVTVNT